MAKLAVHPDAYIRPSPTSGTLGGVAKATRETIVLLEAAGYEVLGGLLDVFMSAVNDLAARGEKAARRSEKLARLLPAECIQVAGESGPYLRLMRMLDFVSGMTDSYAVSLYKKVRGISLPGQ